MDTIVNITVICGMPLKNDNRRTDSKEEQNIIGSFTNRYFKITYICTFHCGNNYPLGNPNFYYKGQEGVGNQSSCHLGYHHSQISKYIIQHD
jgi:hypothetical protein